MKITRTRTAVLVALLAITAGAAPMAAGQSSSGPLVSPTTEELTTGFGGFTVALDDSVIQYDAGGQLRPSWVIGFEAGSAASVQDWANSSDARRIVRLDNSSQSALVAAPAGDMGLTLLDSVLGGSLSDRSYVESLEVNYEMGVDPIETLQPQSEVFDAPSGVVQGSFDQAGVAYTGAPSANPADVRDVLGFDNITTTGQGVDIAVVDTCFSTADGSVLGNGTRGSAIRVDAARDFAADTRTNGLSAVACSGDNNQHHGSWVSSSIAADTTNASFDGPLTDADLTLAQGLAEDGSGETADISAAIRWAEARDTDVLSLSLGSPLYSQEIADSIEHYLNGNGTLVVVASGNSRMNPATRLIASPADLPDDGVVAVGATTAERPTNASSAYFSQVGPNDPDRDGGPAAAEGETVDIAAPGMNTTVKVPTASGTTDTVTLSGTSMATPYVTATAGAILAENPSLENDTAAVREQLLEAARPVPAAGSTEVGHGMAAADLAVNGEQPATEQADARTEAATARDTANRAYSGSVQGWFSGAIQDLSSGLGGFLSDATSGLPV